MAAERSQEVPQETFNHQSLNMNDEFSYESLIRKQLADVPLPSQDDAWEKMKALLQKKKKRRLLPPFFFTGCLPLALIVALAQSC